MKKCLYMVLAALLVATPLFLAGCSSDDDEEGNGENGGSATSTAVLKINGTDTYSCTKLIGVVTVEGSFLNTQSVNAPYEDIIDFDCDTYSVYDFDALEDFSLYDMMQEYYIGGVRFQVEKFDYKTAKKGTVLTHVDDLTHLIYVAHQNGKATENCYSDIQSGTITFESYSQNLYDEEVITLRFNNVVAAFTHSYGDESTAEEKITLDGLVMFKKIGDD